ncbi:MAG: diaminopimelate epimerase [Oscillospiraceae bacterium]|nr:diaminopimelate epimerase [Oscillospiraceae bacterium]
MPFTKMHGAGNDYLYINCFREAVENPAALSVKYSHRHFGVGADGLVLILPSESCDVRMRIFNADGSEAQMCGNASRCVAKYAYERGITTNNPLTLETNAGVKTIQLDVQGGIVRSARVDMGRPILAAANIPCLYTDEIVIHQPLQLSNGEELQVTAVSMGNPHCVSFVENTEDYPLEAIGPLVENHPLFPERVNAEFVRILSPTEIQMRVYERGSGETLACGTGACASVVACVLNGFCEKDTDVTVKLRGGDLVIRWDSATGSVFKTGPAAYVCDGVFL